MGILLPTNMAAAIYRDLKPTKYFKIGLFPLCKSFVKKSLISIFDDVIANEE